MSDAGATPGPTSGPPAEQSAHAPAELRVTPVTGLPEVRPGDDLAALIADRVGLRDGDVVCVAHKIVSKAEGALVPLPAGEALAAARRRLARERARRVVVDAPWVVVTETPQGLVCANGGLDASNAPAGHLIDLPADPDASARALRAGLAARLGVDVGVLITDTFGRPWRLGLTDVAIGCAGMAPLHDQRGRSDREGRPLTMTQGATADAVASVAEVVRHKGQGVPVVRVRGVPRVGGPDGPGAAALQRPAAEDLFPRGRGMLARALAEPQGTPRGDPIPHDDLETARRAAAAQGAQVRIAPRASGAASASGAPSASTAPTRLLVEAAPVGGARPAPLGDPADAVDPAALGAPPRAEDPTRAADPIPDGEQAALGAASCVAALTDLGHRARLAGRVTDGAGWLVEAAAGP